MNLVVCAVRMRCSKVRQHSRRDLTEITSQASSAQGLFELRLLLVPVTSPKGQ